MLVCLTGEVSALPGPAGQLLCDTRRYQGNHTLAFTGTDLLQ